MTYSNRWEDFPDYILGITKEIWEDRSIATLHDYYAPDLIVRSPASVVVGNQAVIGATMATLAEFPDRELLGEDVIWSADDGEYPNKGALSSHRIISTATHSRDGVYGKATGKRLKYRILADCHAVGQTIDDEWLIRDQSAIVQQLGWEPRAYAADLITREGGVENAVRPCTPATDVQGPYKGHGNDHELGQRHADLLTRIMNADMAAIGSEYDRAAHLEYPGHVTGHGWADADQFWMPLRAAFPNAKFEIHHQIGRMDDGFAPRSAIRWSLTGTHSGWGGFGTPTGMEAHIMGISHAEWGPRGLRREYTLFDETAVWKQILLAQG
jgi:hypothetical protein